MPINSQKTNTPARKKAVSALTAAKLLQALVVNDKFTAFAESLFIYLWSFRGEPVPGTTIDNMWQWWQDNAPQEVRRPSYVFGVLKFLRMDLRRNGECGGVIDKKSAITIVWHFFQTAADDGWLLDAVKQLFNEQPALSFPADCMITLPEPAARRRTAAQESVTIVEVAGVKYHATEKRNGTLVLGAPVEAPKVKKTATKKKATRRTLTK